MRTKIWGAVIGILIVSLVASMVVHVDTAQAAPAVTPPAKVYVCKYVGKPGVDERLQTGQNPIEVSVNAIPEDPVTVGSYFADAQGRSYVLGFVPMDPEPTAADCPPGDNGGDHTWSATFTPSATCSDARLDVAVFEDGQQVATDQLDFGNVWSDPYTLESYTASGTYSYGGQNFPYNETINEPANCLKEHQWQASFTGDANCSAAWIDVVVYEDDAIVKTDKIDLGNPWTDPYKLESKEYVDTYSYGGQTFGYDVTINEPEACLIQHEYTATFTPGATCSDAWLDVAVFQDGKQVATDQIDFGNVWSDPYTTESYTATGTYSYGGQDFPYNETINEPSDCTIVLTHDHKLAVDPTCLGYSVEPKSDDGGIFLPDQDSAPSSGLWKEPKNPNESVTVKGTWTWPDGFTLTDSVTIKKPATCTVKKAAGNWKPVCPVCDLKISGKEKIVSWPTDRGDAGWKSRNLEGPLPAGVAVYISVQDCSTSKAARCTLTQKLHAEYNADVFKGKKVQFFDNGSERTMTVRLGADGTNWATYDGTVCTWQDKDRTKCDSSNGWYVLIDGVRQLPYVYPGPNNLLYPYWVCSLPVTFAMTRQAADGSWEVEWLPGMNTWSASIFYLKYTNVWPAGWPEDTTQKSWIWKLPPLSDARKWANEYRVVGDYNYYKLPSK